MTSSNDRAGALLALAVLILALGAITGLAAAPWLRLGTVSEETAESQQLLAALEAQMARQGTAGDTADPQELMLQGETPGIAGAELQRQVSDHVAAAGGQASSFQLMPPRAADGATRLALSFAMRIDTNGLRHVLHAIETGQPLLFIDDIAIRMPDSTARESEGDGVVALDVSMQVSGFTLKDGGR
jgi:general secretion pathway protein M